MKSIHLNLQYHLQYSRTYIKSIIVLVVSSILMMSCKNNLANKNSNTFQTSSKHRTQKELLSKDFDITSLTNQQYPDNPDLGYMAESYDHHYFTRGNIDITDLEKGIANFTFKGKQAHQNIVVNNIDIFEYIPSVPLQFEDDTYLAYLAVINQEWNRNQVRYHKDLFKTSNQKITRVDIARNCLNAYLWEIIIYTQEDGKELPLAHGWFDFPKELYALLFEKHNPGKSYKTFQTALENWVDPESKTVENKQLRNVTKELAIQYKDLSNEMYPVSGARKKKFKEIIYPEKFDKMSDFHTDKSLFATFTPPGFYNRKDPRTTQLGRLQKLDSIVVFKTKTPFDKDSHEIILQFSDENRKTKLTFGGLDIEQFPKLNKNQANKGYKMPMGFSNHSFYESYQTHKNWKSNHHTYYGYLSDEENHWLDSHTIGIDGPVFHWDDKINNKLHIWLLSFERHALVGHYSITFKS